jgi:uncharacterized membrane protein
MIHFNPELVLDTISLVIGLLGVVIILWGVLVGIVQFVALEYKRFRGKNICKPREHLRHHIGSYILLGLEILVGADIIHTVVKPTLHDLAILGSIVAIRTVLSFFLNRELSDAHKCVDDQLYLDADGKIG